jgi:hypothetical protein
MSTYCASQHYLAGTGSLSAATRGLSMNASEHPTEPLPRRAVGDLPMLRAALAWFTTVALCIGAALGGSVILGASLSHTAIRIAGSSLVCGFYGLLAVSSSTLHQRTSLWQAAGVAGVLAATIAIACSLAGIWGSSLGDVASRTFASASLAAIAIGFTAFLVTQQRDEDPRAIRVLMAATATILCVLALVLIIDIAFSSSAVSTSTTPQSSGGQFVFSGIDLVRYVGVSVLLALLGTLLLPVLRRAHPAYRGGLPNTPA